MTAMTRRVGVIALGGAVGGAGRPGRAWALTREARTVGPSPTRQKMTPRERIRATVIFPTSTSSTHEGKKVRFYDDLVKDKTVLSTSCTRSVSMARARSPPRTSSGFRSCSRAGWDATSSFTPYPDTGAGHPGGPGPIRQEVTGSGPGWWFLTGKPADLERLRRELGFTYADPAEDADKTNHIGMVRYGNEPLIAVGGPTGNGEP